MYPPPNYAPVLLEHEVGTELQRIWDDQRFAAFCRHRFLVSHQLLRGSLLFVGIAPTYRRADAGIGYYNGHASNLPYFQPFGAMAAAVGRPWSHLDIVYQQQETGQSGIDQLLQAPNGRAFIQEQLNLFPRLLAAARPCAIIVCSAKARQFMTADQRNGQTPGLGLEFKWDEEIGTFRHQGISTFFSGVLFGARALDTGSRERLTWQVKRALG